MAAPRPERAGDYLLLTPLHVGTATEVWTSVRIGDPSGRLLVYKRPRLGERPSGAAAQAVEREADALRGATSDHLPSLEDAGRLAGLPFVVLSLAEGTSLARLPQRGLPAPGLVRLGLGLCQAVGALHARGRIHGDVAPSNVVVSSYGDVVLIDLGTSTPIGDPRLIAGQPGYAPPEVLREGEATPAQDVYGVGVVLAELALGRRLWPELKLVDAAARGPSPAAVAGIAGLGALLARALDRDEARRPTVAELCDALAALPSDASALGAWTQREDAAHPPTTERALVAVDLVAPLVEAEEVRPTVPAARPDPSREIVIHDPGPLGEAGGRRITAAPAMRERPPAKITFLLAGVGLAGVLAGTLVGRMSRAPKPSSATLAAQVPPRVSIEVDGRAISHERRIEGLRPGNHTITVRFGKQRFEAPIRLEAGEQLVLLPLVRGVTMAAED